MEQQERQRQEWERGQGSSGPIREHYYSTIESENGYEHVSFLISFEGSWIVRAAGLLCFTLYFAFMKVCAFKTI